MTPSIGRIVHYKLSAQDADEINRRRVDATNYRQVTTPPDGQRIESGEPGRTGHVAHVGNHASAGDICPAMIVRTFGGDCVNLQVHLDGTDVFWATSRKEGDGEGNYAWPVRT